MSDDLLIDVSQPDDNAWEYEAFYFDTLDRMAELIVSYGRDRVMADCTELVIKKLNELKEVD